jgi:integrase
MATTAVRSGEVLAFYWDDFDPDAGTLEVRRAFKGGENKRVGEPKNASYRKIKLPPFVTQAIKHHRANQNAARLSAGSWPSEWQNLIFVSSTGHPVDRSNFRRLTARLGRLAGIPNLHPHLCRHSLASHLSEQGVSGERIADLLGNNPKTFYDTYRHRVSDTVGAVVETNALIGQSGSAIDASSSPDRSPVTCDAYLAATA